MGTYIPAKLRRLVYELADRRCEYCLIPEIAVLAAHEVDHIISQKHGGSTESENLALSCALCNKRKGSDIASLDEETGDIVALYHPRRERWLDHFQLADSLISYHSHQRVGLLFDFYNSIVSIALKNVNYS